MFFGFDLKELFMFPFKDEEARKHLLIGGLIAIAAFFIPVLPYLVLIGYSAQISKQVLKGEQPHMIPWEDWGGLIKEGLRLFGIRMIYSLPILIIAMPVFLMGIAMPVIAEGMNSNDAEGLIAVFSLLMVAGMCLIIPISIPLIVIIPAAEMHVVEKDNFSAGFQFKEWWQILRTNLGGFIAAFGIYWALSMVLSFVMQILMLTFILACLLIILIPAMTIYLSLIMYATSAVAYRDGREKLNVPLSVEANA